eukprot:3902403-Rhodomonas_salina.1
MCRQIITGQLTWGAGPAGEVGRGERGRERESEVRGGPAPREGGGGGPKGERRRFVAAVTLAVRKVRAPNGRLREERARGAGFAP